MSQNSIWAWTRVTHCVESSAGDKRPVRNKMPHAGKNIFDGCIGVPPIDQRLLLSSISNTTTITNFASSNDDARVPLATAFGLLFSLGVR